MNPELLAALSPELRAAVMRAYYLWAKKYQPHLLQEWNNK